MCITYNIHIFSFDNMLNGGLWTGECLEVFGIPGTGKTQVMLSLIIREDLSFIMHFATYCPIRMNHFRLSENRHLEKVANVYLGDDMHRDGQYRILLS